MKNIFKKNSANLIFILAFFLLFLAPIISYAQNPQGVNFLIDPSYDALERPNITATNLVNGQYAYFYVEDAYWAKLAKADQDILISNINALSGEFDNTIYPNMRQLYGTEWTPGIDNDLKIYILLTDVIKDAGGYYNPNDEYYKVQVKDNRSNEKEIIYLNINHVGKSTLKAFLAHEFQHMINWYQKRAVYGVDEELWLNEGLSEYAATALGYDNIYTGSNLESRTKNFMRDPSDSLTEWRNLNQDYSTINLFMQFLVDHYGKNILKMIISTPKTGILAVEDALKKIDPNASFASVFSDWTIANYLNDPTVLNGKFSYFNPNLSYEKFHVNSTSSSLIYSNIKAQAQESTKDWAGKWYEFNSSQTLSSPNQSLKIDFSAEDSTSNFLVPYIIKKKDGSVNLNFLSLNSDKKGAAYINDFGMGVSSVIIMPISEKKLSDFTGSEPTVNFSFIASIVQTNAPIIMNISPRSSVTVGGALLTITGENFNANSTVKIGGATASIVSVSGSNTIIAKIPPTSQGGDVNVEVSNPNFSSVIAPQNFTYVPLPIDGSLIRAEGDYKVYVISGKYKRWIQSAEIFNFNPHLGWSAVNVVAPAIRDYYQDSYLIRADGDYRVYEIDSNKVKHHLAISAEQFAASGRSWDMIYITNKAEKNFYKTGAPITK